MIDPQALAEDSLIEEDFLAELRANGRADNTLRCYFYAVNSLKSVGKNPEDMVKKDLVNWSSGLQDKLSENTRCLYKNCVKRYFKWLKTGDLNGGEYPEAVRWMQPSSNTRKLPKEILSHKEIGQLAQAAEKQRDRALVWVGYESGCRPGELLDMRIKDVEFDEYGSQVMVDGKTGERRIRLVESVPDLRTWLSMHPSRDSRRAYLWPSRQSEKLSSNGWYYVLGKIAERAGIKKKVHPHLLRHSRATHLAAKGINEAQMREIFGWTKNSNMPSVYVHLSGRDTDASVLKLYGINVKSSENQLEMGVKKCPFCGHENSPNAKFCEECNGPLDSIAAESSDEKMRQQDRLTQKVLKRLMDRAPEVLEEILREEEISSEVQRLGKSRVNA